MRCPADHLRPLAHAVVGLLVLWGSSAPPPGGWGTWLARVIRRGRGGRRASGRRHPVRHHDRRLRRRPDVRRVGWWRPSPRPRPSCSARSWPHFAAWRNWGETEMTLPNPLTLSRRIFWQAPLSTSRCRASPVPKQTGAVMRLRCRFDQDFTYRLLDNATSRDLVSPPGPDDRRFSTNEKIAHLPRRLDEGGHVPFDDEAPGDLATSRLGQSRLLPRQLHLPWRPDPARHSRAGLSRCWCAASSRLDLLS